MKSTQVPDDSQGSGTEKNHLAAYESTTHTPKSLAGASPNTGTSSRAPANMSSYTSIPPVQPPRTPRHVPPQQPLRIPHPSRFDLTTVVPSSPTKTNYTMPELCIAWLALIDWNGGMLPSRINGTIYCPCSLMGGTGSHPYAEDI